MKGKGIICIETEWEITTRSSRRDLNSEPLLQFLSKTYSIPYVYRKVATIEELRYYFKHFRKKEYVENYNVFYFSFHGNTHAISLESGVILDLEKLSDLSDGLFEGKFVHFGSCRTMLGSQSAIDNFCYSSGAKMVSGFTTSVDCALCAIHDAAFMAEIMSCKQVSSIIKHMENLYGGLQKKLGFRYAQLR